MLVKRALQIKSILQMTEKCFVRGGETWCFCLRMLKPAGLGSVPIWVPPGTVPLGWVQDAAQCSAMGCPPSCHHALVAWKTFGRGLSHPAFLKAGSKPGRTKPPADGGKQQLSPLLCHCPAAAGAKLCAHVSPQHNFIPRHLL